MRLHSIRSLGGKRFELVVDFGTFEVEIEQLKDGALKGVMTLEGGDFTRVMNDQPEPFREHKAFLSRVMREALALEPGGVVLFG